MKKKLLAAVLSAVCVLSLAACGEKAPESVVESTSMEISEEATPTVLESESTGTYVVMNIPYGDFFAAEFEGGENVDAVTSATMNKPANENLTGGTYHLEDNSKILGVSFPVLVKEGVSLDDSLKVADEAARLCAQFVDGLYMSSGKVHHMDVIPHTGSVRRIVIVSEDRKAIQCTACNL